MTWHAFVLGFVGGVVGGILSGVATGVILHRVKGRFDHNQRRSDAITSLEIALSHLEDEWQSSGGRITNHRSEERQRRLDDLRNQLDQFRLALGKHLNRQLVDAYRRMASHAGAGRATEVRNTIQEALALLDQVSRARPAVGRTG